MKNPATRKTKRVKPVLEVINCAHCGQPFQPKREWQKFCKPTCRFTVGNKKRDRVIAAAKSLIDRKLELKVNMSEDLHLYHLYLAVCDLEGWNKDGERPCSREKSRKP